MSGIGAKSGPAGFRPFWRLAGRPSGLVSLIGAGAILASVVSASSMSPIAPSAPGLSVVAEAPDAASAVLAAHRQGSRVEVIDQRTETRTTFANPDGGMTSELTVVPTRVRRGSGWAAVDTTLAVRGDGMVAPKAALGDLTLSGGGLTAPLAQLNKDGKALALHWSGALPKPVLAGNEATYPEVLAGVDLVLRAERSGYQQLLVVKTVEAARNPALAAVGLRVVAEGLRLTAEDSGALRAVDDAGQVVFTAPPSVMWDSSGPAPSNQTTSRSAPVGVALDGDTLTLRPDQKFLTDPATVYPVVVDPRWDTFEKWGWATVLSGKPEDEYWWSSGAGSSVAQVGQCNNAKGDCNGIGEAWAFFQFDTSFLGGRTIIEAKVNTTVVHSPNCESRVHRLWKGRWGIDSGTNWNNKPAVDPVDTKDAPPRRSTCDEGGGIGYFAQNHLNTTSMTTFALRADNGGDQIAWRKYDPAATKLEVRHNLKPNPPYNMRTDPPTPAPCKWCGGMPYLGDEFVRLIATLSDPDNDMVRPLWRTVERRPGEEWKLVGDWFGPFQASGATADAYLDMRGKHGLEFGWWLHAEDGATAGDAGGPPNNAFAIDRVGVNVAPTVTSALYQEDNAWHGGVGVPGEFTFGANGVDDINHYLYGWQDPPSTMVEATDRLSGPATVVLAPEGDGPRTLYVQSVDRAGHKSPTKAYRFYVRAGNGPRSQWSLEGNTNDAAFLGDRDGTLHGNAKYTNGAVGTALLLDGTADTYMTAPNTIRTDASFSVAAWVKLDRTDTGSYTVVSQDGNSVPGFALQYEGSTQRWVFVVPNQDVVGSTVREVSTGVPPVAGKWTHLAVTYDIATWSMTLYVNGTPSGRGPRPYDVWNAPGELRIGNADWGANLERHWPGAIDEVQVYDRVLSDAEVKAAVSRDNVQVAHWKFDDKDGSTAKNSVEGGDDGVLTNGAAFTDDGAVGRAVQFDGNDDHVVSSGPALRTDLSFTVAAWVNAREFVDGGKSMTAVSQDGNANSGFYLQYNSGVKKWVFMKFTRDDTSPDLGWIGVQASQQPVLNDWVHLAGVYDAHNKRMKVYVNGELGGFAENLPEMPWQATGPVAFGRAKFGGNLTDYWPGKIDEVRLYSRVLSVEELQGIVSRNDVAVASWKLDGSPASEPGRGPAGELGGGPAWTAGQSTNPDPTDLAISLDGTDDHLRAPAVVNSGLSFSATAWVRLNATPSRWAAVLSQNGTHTAAFNVGYTGGRWAFAMHGPDIDSPSATRVLSAEPAQQGVWTHLAAVYNSGTGEMRLYVNGVFSAADKFTAPWTTPTVEFDIGRAKWANVWQDYLPGAVDDVKVYSRPLFAEEVRVMAGRDLSLVHNWQLDEGVGANAADGIGGRGGTLSGGAGYGPGRVGNAVTLDGKDGVVSTTGVDLRTDQSFTVAAWVYLDPGECVNACRVDAVSMDGGQPGQPSKFRLGHKVDKVDARLGRWIFEMPALDGLGEAAVPVMPGKLRTWVHLIAVYDAPTKKIWLYVDEGKGGQDDGTLTTPWQGTGGLRIGRGSLNGAATGFWPGSVDDVRLYTGAFDKDRIMALYRSYPAPDAPATLPVADAGHWTFDEGTGTTVADSSGRGRTATMRGGAGAGWIGGRSGRSSWLDGTTGYAETDGPVLDTGKSFSVTTWAYLKQDTGGNRTMVGQDGNQVGSFLLQYNEAERRWAVVVPTAPNGQTSVLLTSDQQVPHGGLWTHLGVVYDAALHQLRLYVNGRLSATQVGVSILESTGPFSMGRGRWNGGNADYFPGGVDDVRAFGRALSDGEVRKVHDDAPLVLHGWWAFDGKPDDISWRNNPTTLSGGTSYVPGVRGQAVQLDGTSGSATGRWLGVNTLDSFTVSAWAKLTRTDRDATIVAQDGARTSGFVLQYNKNIGRWVFGAATQDADFAQLVHAHSPQQPALNAWTHLTGVYDYPARQVRLYVNGELAGIQNNAPILVAHGNFTIGRGKANGEPAGFFSGTIDEVQTDLGMATEEEIRSRGGHPPPAGGQLGRFVNATGDHYTANSTAGHSQRFTPVPPGYRYEGPMGKLLPSQQPNTKLLYACLFGTDEVTSADPNCEGKQKLAELGWIYTQQPGTVATIAVYRCNTGLDHFESLSAGCEGHTNDGLLGYTVAYAALVRYFHPLNAERITTTYGTPAGYRFEGTIGLLSQVDQPGTRSLYTCRDSMDEFVSLDSACEGKTVVASLGRLWTAAPVDKQSRPIYPCRLLGTGDRFVSAKSDCEGHTVDGAPLGHVLTAVPTAPAGE